MKTPRHRLTTLSLFSLLALGAGARGAIAAPKQGDFELRLGNTSAGVLGVIGPSGVENIRGSSGRSLTLFGLNTGFGYFVSDAVELGLSLDLAYIDASNSQTMVGFAPFLKALLVKDNLGFFFQLAPGVAHISASGGNSDSAFDLNVGLGLEAFVSPMWSLRLGPKYELIKGSGDAVHGVGVNWGISAYF